MLINLDIRNARKEFERWYFIELLIRTSGNVTKAAQIAGMGRGGFVHKLRKLNITEVAKLIREGVTTREIRAYSKFKLDLLYFIPFEHESTFTRNRRYKSIDDQLAP